MVVIFIAAEIRRMWIRDKVERWRQDIASVWFYAAILGALYFFQRTVFKGMGMEFAIAMGIVAFTGLRSIYSSVRLRRYKPPPRESDKTGNVSYR